ncbi:hypothetical protein ACFXKC_58505 [Streptomyces sp. NPDC059340]|uniref:hypothetical protein n=1 Tax=Streptomyces sp. NPDC059340 TaxID=3346806 RepID=UPI0036978D15
MRAACHAEFGAHDPLLSRLYLSDVPVYGYEPADLRVRPGLVVPGRPTTSVPAGRPGRVRAVPAAAVPVPPDVPFRRIAQRQPLGLRELLKRRASERLAERRRRLGPGGQLGRKVALPPRPLTDQRQQRRSPGVVL